MRQLLRSVRTPPFIVCLGLFVLLDGFELFTDLRWVGEWGWTPDMANAGLFVSSCLLAGLVAFLSNPYFASSFRQVAQAGSAASRLRLFASVWLRNLLLGVVGHAIVLCVALAITASTGPTDAIQPLVFVYSLLPILIFVSLGTLASAYAPNPLVSVLVIGLAYLVAYNAASGNVQVPIVVSAETAGMVGLEFSASSALVWGGVALAITGVLFGAGLLVALARRSSVATGVALLACLVALVGPSVAGVQLPSRVQATTGPTATICAGSAPRICVAPGHTRQLDVVARRVHATAAPLRRAGVDLAGTRLYEEGNSYRPGTGILSLDPSALNLASYSARDYAQALSQPSDCAALWGRGAKAGTSASRLLTTADALTSWVYARVHKDGRDDPDSRHSDAWALRAYAALAHCQVSAGLAATITK